jgi:hypothetical protein
MKRSLACLGLTGLALATATLTVLSAQPSGDVDLLVNGTPQARYLHDGRWYVEAMKGREYAIRLRNPYGVRVAVALAVDGLNTIDARHTTAGEARKWIIDPYQTITISGWQTSQQSARRFEFTTEERSYAQALGQPTDLGLITAVYYRERPRVQVDGMTTRSQPGGAGAPSGGAGGGRGGRAPERKDEAPVPDAAPPARAEAQAQAGSLDDVQAAPGATAANRARRDEYAATGMGRQTDHPITTIWLDLENTPAQQVNIRYEFRPQLVKLGILPRPLPDPLSRRENANGFEPGFSPAPPYLR